MTRTRFFGLMLASTAFVSVANAAFALDGADVLAKINALTSPNGTTIEATAETDGDTVTLKGASLKISTVAGNALPVGDIVLEGVAEEEGGYTIEKATLQNVDYKKDADGVTVEDIYIENIAVPATVTPGSIESMFIPGTIHVGPVKITASGKETVSIDEMNFTYTTADDKSRVDMDGSISGISIDATSAPDPKAQEALKALELETISGKVTLKGGWSLGDGKLDITEYSFDFEDIGRLDINMSLSGYTPQFIKSLQEASKAAAANPDQNAAQQAAGMAMLGLVQQLTYNGAKIRFDDAGITAKILDYAGKQQGMDGTQFAQAAKAMVPMMIAQLNMPDLQAQITTAVNAYLDDPKSIEVSATPAQPLPFPQIMGAAMGNPAALTQTLNVKVQANQ